MSPTSAHASKSDLGTGVILILIVCISVQFGAAFAVHLFPALGPWGTSGLRIGVAALVTVCAVRPKFWKWTREQWMSSIVLGLALGMMNGVFYSSLAKLPLGLAVAFEFVGPLVLAIVLSRRAIDAVWISLAVVGMALLGLDSRSEGINVYGIFLALLAGFFWACYILASEKVGRVFHDAEGLSVGLVVALLVTLPLGAKGAAFAFTDIHLLGFAVITGLMSSLVPSVLELAALRRMPRNVFSILLSRLWVECFCCTSQPAQSAGQPSQSSWQRPWALHSRTAPSPLRLSSMITR